jgi:hypothetical protein
MEIKTSNIEEKIEDKVIDWIALGAGGRLIVSKPNKSIFGEDLLIEKRGDYKGEDIFIKVCSLIGPVDSEKITKDFLQDNFKTDKNFYLLFAYFDSVKQKISDYIWLIPSMQFKDMAELTESADGQKILRFESFLDIKQKDKYSKFLVYTKELGKLAFETFEAGGKFKFKETVFQETKAVNLESLKEFITEARANTYAANNSPADNPRLLGSVQLDFQKGNLFYRDVYFSGNKRFIGQEIIYQDSKPVWGMNYIGDEIGKLETSFLKDSLFRLAGKCRLGQNCEFEKREFKYEDLGQGSLDDFFGQEKIFVSGKSIYKLDYKGGLISDKL